MSLLKMAANPNFNSIRLTAYEALLKYGVESLPINFDYGEDIMIFSMQFLAGFHHEDPGSYIHSWEHNGIVLYSMDLGKYVIFFNADDPIDSIRWSLATAIGYIEMGYKYRVFERGITLKRSVSSVDAFSFFYTCPDFLAYECELTTAEKIMEFCKIPFHHAREKAALLKLRDSQTADEKEQKLIDVLREAFSGFINSTKTGRPSIPVESNIDVQALERDYHYQKYLKSCQKKTATGSPRKQSVE